MANITRTEAAGFMPSIWANVALGYLPNYFTIGKLVQKHTEFDEGQTFTVGETFKVPKRGTLSVNDKGENANYTIQNPTSSTIDLTLNKHKEVTFAIERRALTVVNQDVIAGYIQDAIMKLAEQIDTDLFAQYANAGTTIGTNVAITEANIQAARKALVTNKAPAGMPRYGIVSPDQVNNMLLIDRLVRYDSVGGDANNIANGTVGSGTGNSEAEAPFGKVYTFQMWESQLVPNVTSVYKNLFFAKDAITMASRPMADLPPGVGAMSVTVTDPNTGISITLTYAYNATAGAMMCTLEILYGSVCTRPEHLILVNTN